MNLLLKIYIILGFIGTIGTIGYLIAPKLLSLAEKVRLKRQRKRFEREALKEKYRVQAPVMLTGNWYEETYN